MVINFQQLDLQLQDEAGGDISSFITNGEWDLLGEFLQPLYRLIQVHSYPHTRAVCSAWKRLLERLAILKSTPLSPHSLFKFRKGAQRRDQSFSWVDTSCVLLLLQLYLIQILIPGEGLIVTFSNWAGINSLAPCSLWILIISITSTMNLSHIL